MYSAGWNIVWEKPASGHFSIAIHRRGVKISMHSSISFALSILLFVCCRKKQMEVFFSQTVWETAKRGPMLKKCQFAKNPFLRKTFCTFMTRCRGRVQNPVVTYDIVSYYRKVAWLNLYTALPNVLVYLNYVFLSKHLRLWMWMKHLRAKR
jgi:hypothetical protein